ncbi:MAG: PaaI family thioesterase [Myxococcota bacterium]|nr:PaaI family thioesterase [Myxococcota bacterium]
MDIQTHPDIDRALCGQPTLVEPGRAVVQLTTTERMRVDAKGLVHGGFVFGAADHAAMLAVNDPNVVLGSTSLRFTAPVRVGETVACEAVIHTAEGRKRVLSISARVGPSEVLRGEMTAFVLDKHVLD